MEASLWVSKTGLDAQQTRMTVISNNLANVNTVGFKRDRAVFEDLLYQNIRQPGGSTGADNQAPTGLMMGTGVRVVATEKSHSQGSMIQTKNALDLAIQGEGMFQVLQPDGTFAYTRDGSFKLSVDRELVTSNGMQLQPAITIPQNAESISIGEAQHAFVLDILRADDITPIGDVINGQNRGRIGDDDVTLFDGTGVGLQDLAVASAAVKVADARGLAMKISL